MSSGDYVILLHGLGRTANSMRKIEKYLKRSGYQVLNINYPSTRHSIEKLVTNYVTPKIQDFCLDPHRQIHFVTHSMGGILLRQYLRYSKPMNLGRVVMLAPPNRGSKLAEMLRGFFLFRWLLGPAGLQLGLKKNSLPLQLPSKVDFQLGVVAGDYKFSGLGAFYIPGPNDGTVSVVTTKIKGMKDFVLVHRSHTFIMMGTEVIEYICKFIKHGQFAEVRDQQNN